MRKEGEASLEYEVVNQARALWTLPRTQSSDEEYRQFYQYLTHNNTDPLAWTHNKVEGKREYTSLLYLPARAPFDLWQREAVRGLKLYVRRVFIMDDAEQFLPLYLRFAKGVVDSSDLPLNISREILQQDPEVEAIRSGLTRRVLDLLARLAKDEPEKYATFWREFGTVLKEGIVQDHANQNAILPLLRFAGTHNADNSPSVSLADYLSRMKPGQDRIYYVIAETLEAARGSPAIERLKERGLEVLLLAERIDEWMMGQLDSYEGKRFKDASRGDLELGGLASDADRQQHDARLRESKGLLKRIKDALAERTALAGLTGPLQALIETPQIEAGGMQVVTAFAVVCHPHPLYGGTMDNKVVYTLARTLEQLGAPAIRFNFRGVGSSAGQYDEGRGETDDALAAIAYGRQRWPGAQPWLAGFSFGGAVALRAAAQGRPQRLITVAPGISIVPVTDVEAPACPWLIVQGDADEVVPPEAVRSFAQRLSPAPELKMLAGAGHFFHGRLNELRDVVLAFMREAQEAPLIAQPPGAT